MLEHLKMRNLGPATELDFQFGKRINVLTGDNGLGIGPGMVGADADVGG